DGNRIEENGNAGVSRSKLNHARNRRALKQLKYSKHYVQCFFRRILKLLAHAHHQSGISEGNNFHNPVIPSEVEESRGSTDRFYNEILRLRCASLRMTVLARRLEQIHSARFASI